MYMYYRTYVVSTKMDNQYSRFLVAGNPWYPCVKKLLKDGGVRRLITEMRDPGWDAIVKADRPAPKSSIV